MSEWLISSVGIMSPYYIENVYLIETSKAKVLSGYLKKKHKKIKTRT